MHHYTPEDLILFLYKETSLPITAGIEEALQIDWTLREKLAVLKASISGLDTVVESPRASVVSKILKYASQSEIISQ